MPMTGEPVSDSRQRKHLVHSAYLSPTLLAKARSKARRLLSAGGDRPFRIRQYFNIHLGGNVGDVFHPKA